MKKLQLNQTTSGILFLLAGLTIGWLIFGGSSSPVSHDDHAHDSVAEVWTCSMHPQVREDGPGKCPLCAMDLIPVNNSRGSALMDNEIQISESAVQIASIHTEKVKRFLPRKEILLSGIVEADERNIATVTAHFNGRVEKLYADFTGQYIKKGEKLADLYSPDLVNAQKELFEAAKFKATNPALYESVIRKLKLWELTDQQIERIIKAGKPQYSFSVYAPRSGTIMERKISVGEHVMDGMVLFSIVDLNNLWVVFDAYESDLPWINTGDSITFKIQSAPGQIFKSKVTFIDPTIDNTSRTASVRTEIVNTNKLIKPNMFVEGTIQSQIDIPQNAVVIPKSAILWTGKRAIVYVKQPHREMPTFAFREIELGAASGDYYIVQNGLAEDEEIAINGVFKIDASAQLAGKTSMMNVNNDLVNSTSSKNGNSDDSDQKAIAEMAEGEINPKFKLQLKQVFDSYLPLKDALVASDFKSAKLHAEQLLGSIKQVDMTLVTGDLHVLWMKQLNVLQSSVNSMLNLKDVAAIREELSPLSDQLYRTLTSFQVETGGFRQFCPMAFDFKGAYWLSDSDEILNPYFGDEMLNCGSIDEELE